MWPMRWMVHKRRGLRMWIIGMLASSPRNGAEIMNEIEVMTHGWWRPSPGSVYPLLDELTREGLITKREDGRYELTEKAAKEMEWPFAGGPFGRPQTVEDILREIAGYVSYLEDLRSTEAAKVIPHLAALRSLGGRLVDLGKSRT